MNNEKENKMAVMPMKKLVLNMSFPLMLSLLIQSLYNIVDSIFVAKLSESALTATSLVFPMQLLMIAVGVGVNAVLSRNIGAKNEKMIENVAATGVVLSIISTLVFVVIGLLFTKTFVHAFTDDEQIAEYAIEYLSICMIFCVGSLVSTMFQRFLQAVGDTFCSMVSLIAGAVTNIILDSIMIFGLLGFPALEVRGAAIATVIGQCVSAIVAIWLNAVKNPTVKINFKGYKINSGVVGQIYKVGLPTIVTQAVGSIMVAAINAIFYKIPIGVSIAVIATIIFMVFPTQLLSLFSASADMLEIGVPALRIISVTFALSSITMILGYSMSGMGNGVINMLGTALRQLIIFVPVAYLFAKYCYIDKVWYSMWISEVLAVIYAVLASYKELKKIKGLSK
jgi:Na+-driven multidrug efflux pump